MEKGSSSLRVSFDRIVSLLDLLDLFEPRRILSLGDDISSCILKLLLLSMLLEDITLLRTDGLI